MMSDIVFIILFIGVNIASQGGGGVFMMSGLVFLSKFTGGEFWIDPAQIGSVFMISLSSVYNSIYMGEYGMSPAQVGGVFMTSGLVMVFCTPIAGVLIDRGKGWHQEDNDLFIVCGFDSEAILCIIGAGI